METDHVMCPLAIASSTAAIAVALGQSTPMLGGQSKKRSRTQDWNMNPSLLSENSGISPLASSLPTDAAFGR